VTYSEQFDNAAWTKVLSTITANDTTSPDGTQNADLLTTTNTGICYIYQLLSGTSGAYSASMYVKNGNNNYFALNVQGSAGNWAVAIFDLTNGSLGQYAQGANGGFVYVNHTITNVGNGWYRCVLNYTTTQSTYFCPMFAPLKTGNSFSAAYGEAQNNANNKTMYVWGAQVEASSYPTSLITTTSASATRVADACFKTGISSLIPTEGTLFCDFTINGFQAFTNICGLDNIGTDNATVRFWSGVGAPGMTVAGVYAQIFYAGNVLVQLISTTPNERIKGAIRYKSGDVAVYVNGIQIFAGTSTFTPVSLNQLTFTRLWSGAEFANTTNIKEAVIFPVLTNAELASLTTI
jgi:hypothetical protein